ncbi:metal/formaldehyde-sensitive transcriptional repressor [Janthinobacterium sp.]|uniref:metal/formaldehyde-sensitive transcriptional repressor n=1 Tax=Janthinobacterium sp. TaxID=1871054 RepID=UPI00293D51E8|nr:metal/formaldehyde-sensitive transcriptional repressor [Janthinobacterium sp.]
MGHTSREKTKLLNRVRRLRGQVEAIERALEGDSGCAEILQLIAATRGAINGLMGVVIEDHIREHVASPDIASDAERAQGADELIDVIRSYLK